MTNNKIGDHFLESFVDVAAELLAYNKQNSNPPTPSLNNFSESELQEENISISNQEAEQILNILKNLQEELENKDEKIQQLQTKVQHSEIKNTKTKATQPKLNFKSELSQHAENLDLITALIQSGGKCCELTGNAFRVHSDFIILLDETNSLIKIKIDKIAAIKILESNQNKKESTTSEDNDKCETKNSVSENELKAEKPEQDLQAV